jgi:prepilin-type N-terminal cleavage/methylation domain-containing protein
MRRAPDDEGYSLIEVMMAMVCMSILMTLVTSAVIQVYHAVNGVDAITSAQTEVNTSFMRLDKEVRYARAISTPGAVAGDQYVEYLLSVDSVDTCVELRLNNATQELQRRQWVKNQTPLTPTPWQTLAAYVSGATPFTVTAADSSSLTSFRYQRLTLDVTSVTGGGPGQDTAQGRAGSQRETNVTFTALNTTDSGASSSGTSTAAQIASTCTEGRGVTS